VRAKHARFAVASVLAASLALSAEAPARPDRAVRAVAASTRLQVTQVEYRLILSSSNVSAGAVNLEALDRGRDPHDLRLRAAGSRQEIAAPELKPGEHWNAVVHLKPGVYRLWCSLPQHARLGMHTTLTVR
jgi:uncharacterized cupredoxin-like copper-binding protein